jgi:pimeloyl-ACP methyl ester carboxylesterase
VDVASRADAPNEPTTENKNLVFLHGYNVNQQQARGVESEMFKRFYWSDSKAKFYGVTWNGSVSQGNLIPNISCNLQTNIVNAFLTAPYLASFLNGLAGDTTVVAHSLGNMVTLSAISDYGAAPSHYFMIDSAVAMEAIDGSTAASPDMVHPDWASYTNSLYASKWFNLWPSSDARSTLTWSNRFENLAGVDIYNFYSSGEEVLRDFPGAPPSDLADTITDIISQIEAGVDEAAFVWVWQEKDKGRMRENNFISSSHGGWLFNSYYQTASLAGLINMPTDQAALLTDDQLRTNAFFDTSVDTALFATNTSGSTYAAANRDRILSDAIPALTLPAGANNVAKFHPQNEDDRNFNMSSPDGVSFSAFQNGWPSNRPTEEVLKWHHSDFDYVAYPFTYQLFNKFVTLGNLK